MHWRRKRGRKMCTKKIMPSKIHIYPLNDVYEHDTESEFCKCNPKIEDKLIIHNSFDGREYVEKKYEEILSKNKD